MKKMRLAAVLGICVTVMLLFTGCSDYEYSGDGGGGGYGDSYGDGYDDGYESVDGYYDADGNYYEGSPDGSYYDENGEYHEGENTDSGYYDSDGEYHEVSEGVRRPVNPGGFSQDGKDIPEWDGLHAWVEINNNEPYFTDEEKQSLEPFEIYSDLDSAGRCGVAYANICVELMPTEDRGEIGDVRPTGWHTIKYNDLISGNYLYNRCHLIGFQLAGENANEKNLITGTRYLNINGMLDFEDEIDQYVDDTGNHVLYRVTPMFRDEELVARGVLMEAYSIEDDGAGVKFCVFAYNAQPGIGIDYHNGESWRLENLKDEPVIAFVLNTKTGKFHLPDCESVAGMSQDNRLDMNVTLSAMLKAGYSPCGSCHPDQAGGE